MEQVCRRLYNTIKYSVSQGDEIESIHFPNARILHRVCLHLGISQCPFDTLGDRLYNALKKRYEQIPQIQFIAGV